MRHDVPVAELGPQGLVMADAIGSCVHCGFCLPSCPTYQELGEEMDSPRGRIILMKEVLEGGLELEAALPHVDACLGCRACETACPSGVPYGDLLTPFRAYAEEHRDRPAPERAQRELLLRLLPHPGRFRLAARLGVLARPIARRRRARRLLPASTVAQLELLPERIAPAEPSPQVVPAEGPRRARVALLAGCAQQVLEPGINAATLRVLARNGVEVVVPPGQGCCGALAMHTGAAAEALPLVRRNLDAFEAAGELDAVITNAAGCGAAIGEYPLLLAGEPDEGRARALAEKAVDVSAFLHDLGLVAPPPPLPGGRRRIVAYQDACHLAHAQGVRDAPRALLEQVEGLELVAPRDAGLCCGSAGTYNVERPEIAGPLGERKARALLETGAEEIASGNIGCIAQVGRHLRELGSEVPVRHTIEVLDRAYRGVGDAERA